MRLAIIFIDFLIDKLGVIHHLEHLLQDHALKFETTHVSVVCHHSHCVSDDKQIEVLIEDGSYLRFIHYNLIETEHGV